MTDIVERLRLSLRFSPARAEWFEVVCASVEPSPADYRAMLLVDDEPGCSSIVAQMMLDQDALDIAEIINAANEAATEITTLRAELAAAMEYANEHGRLRAENEKLREALGQAVNNLEAGTRLYECPGLEAAAKLARAALGEPHDQG